MQSRDEKVSLVVPIMELIERFEKEPRIPFVWSGIKKGSFGYIFGPAKSGKTIFCENLALSLAASEPEFLGSPLSQDDPNILIINLEEYWRQRTERNSCQVKSMDLPQGTNLKLLMVQDEFPRYLNITNQQGYDLLYKTIEESGAEIVFIDSLTRIMPREIEKSTFCQKSSLLLRELADKLNITLIAIHHTPKQYGAPITIDSLAGSRVLAQEADFIIGINRGINGTRYIKEVAFRYKQENDDAVQLFDIDDNLWIKTIRELPEYELLKEPDRRNDDANLRKVLGLLEKKSTEADGVFKSGEIEKEAKPHMSRSTYYNKLDELQSEGKIAKTRKGIYILKDSDKT